MIEIYPPSEEDIHRIQDGERAFYWSCCADTLLRKHGLLNCVTRSLGTVPSGLPIILRGARPSWPIADRHALLEGPLAPEVLSELGLEAEAVECKAAWWLDEQRQNVARMIYSGFKVKPIPTRRGETTEARLYDDPDPRWNNRTIRMQTFKPSNAWRPVGYVEFEDGGEKAVAAVTNGRHLVVGAPLFDVAAFLHALPALDAGFYGNVNGTDLFALERWAAERIGDLAGAAGIELQRIPIWPNGHRGALSLRHDYDRPVDDDQFADMLAFYRQLGLKATWFLLVNKWPKDGQVKAMVEEGHEIALHSEAPYFNEFREEVRRFQELSGCRPAGYTCHGGIGSRGQLALAQYEWSEQLGLTYGEMIGRHRGLPHPVHLPVHGIPATGRLIIQNSHFSFDLNTTPEGHQLERMVTLIPAALKSGAHVIIMNHPDIHWPEWRSLLQGLDPDGIWNCTFVEAATWSLAAKFNRLSPSEAKQAVATG